MMAIYSIMNGWACGKCLNVSNEAYDGHQCSTNDYTFDNMFQHEGREIITLTKIDKHLAVVLVAWGNQYVTWIYNASFDSFNHGCYFDKNSAGFHEALSNYVERRNKYL